MIHDLLCVFAVVRRSPEGVEWILPHECAATRDDACALAHKSDQANPTFARENPILRITVLGDLIPLRLALKALIEAAEILADNQEATLPTPETRGDQRKVTPANMFLSVGASDVRQAIDQARAALG